MGTKSVAIERVEFFVPCCPVAQPRQRHRTMKARGRSFIQNYTPETHPVNAFKRAVRFWAKPKFPTPLEGPIAIDLVLMFPRPKSARVSLVRTPKAAKPDWDNVGKAICDALNGLAWSDDAQVSDARVRKRLVATNGAVGVHVTISMDEGVDG